LKKNATTVVATVSLQLDTSPGTVTSVSNELTTVISALDLYTLHFTRVIDVQ